MTMSMDWYLSDVEHAMMKLPGIRVRRIPSPTLTAAQREQSHEADRNGRSLSAQRAETVAVACPTCDAGQGEPCNRRIARKSARKSLLGFHAERFDAAMGTPAQPMAISEPAKPASSTSATVPVSEKAKPRRRGPSNRADLPFHKRRFQEARKRSAHARGDYLSDGVERPRPTPRIKFRPAAAAALKVSVGPVAWAEVVRLTQIEDGDRETGGALVGAVTNGTVRIVRATGPGRDAEQTKTSVQTRVSQNDIDAIITASKADVREIGSWHSHPHGLGEPSRSDMASLVADKEVMGIEHPVMVIVRPSLTSGWVKPVAVAWVLTDSDIDGYQYDIRIAEMSGPLT